MLTGAVHKDGRSPSNFWIPAKPTTSYSVAVNEEPEMPHEEFDERERALQYAARLKGLTLIRTGDTFALAKITDATLDEIAAYLASDGRPEIENLPAQEQRRADLRAMLKAERALIAEIAQEKRGADMRNLDHKSTEAALAEIRRRIAEIQEAKPTETSNITS
jgi:hypothetical protein